MSYIRGILTTESGALGAIQSVNHNPSAEEAVVENEKGEVIHSEYFNPVNTVSLEVAFDNSKTLPNFASLTGEKKNLPVTLSNCIDTNLNGKYNLENATLNEQGKQFIKYTMNLKRYLANGVPANDA